jgi:hypothetical protein
MGSTVRPADRADGHGLALISTDSHLAGDAGSRKSDSGDGKGDMGSEGDWLGGGCSGTARAMGWAMPCPSLGCNGDVATPRLGRDREFWGS